MWAVVLEQQISLEQQNTQTVSKMAISAYSLFSLQGFSYRSATSLRGKHVYCMFFLRGLLAAYFRVKQNTLVWFVLIRCVMFYLWREIADKLISFWRTASYTHQIHLINQFMFFPLLHLLTCAQHIGGKPSLMSFLWADSEISDLEIHMLRHQ